MKNLFFLLLLILMATVCGAQVKLQTNKEGGYKIKPDSLEWFDAGFTTSPEALKYSSSFTEARSNPGKKIEVDSFEVVNIKLFLKKPCDFSKIFIVYNDKENNIDLIKNAPSERDDTFYFILFSFISIFLMILSGILSKYRVISIIIMTINVFLVAIIAINLLFLVFIGLIYNTINIAFFISAFSALIAGIFSSLAAIALVSKDQEKYRRIEIIFCVLMAVHIVLMFA